MLPEPVLHVVCPHLCCSLRRLLPSLAWCVCAMGQVGLLLCNVCVGSLWYLQPRGWWWYWPITQSSCFVKRVNGGGGVEHRRSVCRPPPGPAHLQLQGGKHHLPWSMGSGLVPAALSCAGCCPSRPEGFHSLYFPDTRSNFASTAFVAGVGDHRFQAGRITRL